MSMVVVATVLCMCVRTMFLRSCSFGVLSVVVVDVASMLLEMNTMFFPGWVYIYAKG